MKKPLITRPDSRLGYLKNFYIGTFFIWVVWVVFLDTNNVKTMWSNRSQRIDLEHERDYYKEQIRKVTRERNEVFGDKNQIEKWAREQYLMHKPGETVFVLLDEMNKPLQTTQENQLNADKIE